MFLLLFISYIFVYCCRSERPLEGELSWKVRHTYDFLYNESIQYATLLKMFPTKIFDEIADRKITKYEKFERLTSS